MPTPPNRLAGAYALYAIYDYLRDVSAQADKFPPTEIGGSVYNYFHHAYRRLADMQRGDYSPDTVSLEAVQAIRGFVNRTNLDTGLTASTAFNEVQHFEYFASTLERVELLNSGERTIKTISDPEGQDIGQAAYTRYTNEVIPLWRTSKDEWPDDVFDIVYD